MTRLLFRDGNDLEHSAAITPNSNSTREEPASIIGDGMVTERAEPVGPSPVARPRTLLSDGHE